MPEIIFDALVPTAEIPALFHRFEKLATAMGVTVSMTKNIEVDPYVAEQLQGQIPEEDTAPREFVRYIVQAASNLNETAMTFARVLTPHADLPPEPVLLEKEAEFEVAADYPWTVVIQP